MEMNHEPFAWAYPLYDELIEQMTLEYEKNVADGKQA